MKHARRAAAAAVKQGQHYVAQGTCPQQRRQEAQGFATPCSGTSPRVSSDTAAWTADGVEEMAGFDPRAELVHTYDPEPAAALSTDVLPGGHLHAIR